jgi:hypothetical protein
MTYSSVVSRDSVQVGFMLAVLNRLDVMACNLENAYLNAPCMGKIWFEGGLEYGSDKGNVCCCLCFVWFEIGRGFMACDVGTSTT